MALANCPGLHHAASRHAGPGSTHAQAPKVRVKSPRNPAVPRDGSGAGALWAGLHRVEAECAVVVDIYQDAKPAGNSRSVNPEGVVALLAGVRAIEDLVPAGI